MPAYAVNQPTTLPAIDELANVIARFWSRETSYDPAGWSHDNPAWGHCAVTALLVQDVFGGDVLAGAVNGLEHYWNRLPSQLEVDLTRHQFPSVNTFTEGVPVPRDALLAYPETNRRYVRLRTLAMTDPVFCSAAKR